MTASTDKIATFKELIFKSERIVFFTGAGISTESGIPDFRSPNSGIWTKISPIDFQDYLASEDKRIESWRRWFSGTETMMKAEPNHGHLAVAKLINSGKATTVITQNVDNLHQQSGIAASQVVELHGNAQYAKCLDCEKRYELDWVKEQLEQLGTVKPCQECGGIIKVAFISFGQQLPADEVRRAEQATLDCDLFIVIGSSLSVYPAASFPELATQKDIPLVILNRDPTPLDPIATLTLHEEIGPTMLKVTEGMN